MEKSDSVSMKCTDPVIIPPTDNESEVKANYNQIQLLQYCAETEVRKGSECSYRCRILYI